MRGEASSGMRWCGGATLVAEAGPQDPHHPGGGRGPTGKVVVTERLRSSATFPDWAPAFAGVVASIRRPGVAVPARRREPRWRALGFVVPGPRLRGGTIGPPSSRPRSLLRPPWKGGVGGGSGSVSRYRRDQSRPTHPLPLPFREGGPLAVGRVWARFSLTTVPPPSRGNSRTAKQSTAISAAPLPARVGLGVGRVPHGRTVVAQAGLPTPCPSLLGRGDRWQLGEFGRVFP